MFRWLCTCSDWPDNLRYSSHFLSTHSHHSWFGQSALISIKTWPLPIIFQLVWSCAFAFHSHTLLAITCLFLALVCFRWIPLQSDEFHLLPSADTWTLAWLSWKLGPGRRTSHLNRLTHRTPHHLTSYKISPGMPLLHSLISLKVFPSNIWFSFHLVFFFVNAIKLLGFIKASRAQSIQKIGHIHNSLRAMYWILETKAQSSSIVQQKGHIISNPLGTFKLVPFSIDRSGRISIFQDSQELIYSHRSLCLCTPTGTKSLQTRGKPFGSETLCPGALDTSHDAHLSFESNHTRNSR